MMEGDLCTAIRLNLIELWNNRQRTSNWLRLQIENINIFLSNTLILSDFTSPNEHYALYLDVYFEKFKLFAE